MPTIGDNIRRFRLEAGFDDQGEFAKKLGVPQSSVSRWETDALKPGPANLVRIAVAVGRTVDELLDQSDPPDQVRHRRTGVPIEAEREDTDVRRGYEPDAIPVIAEGEATPHGLLLRFVPSSARGCHQASHLLD